MADTPITIGFANLDFNNLFAVELQKALQQAADAHPNVELIVRDNAMDSARAKANIDEFLAIPVDVAVIFHIDQRLNTQLIFPFRLKKIPTLALHIPIAGSYYYGIDESATGRLGGEALVEWVEEHWDNQIDRVICFTDRGFTDTHQMRMDSVVQVLRDNGLIEGIDPFYIDNGSSAEVSKRNFLAWLDNSQDTHGVVMCVNDNTASGVIQALEETGRTNDFAIVSFDGTEVAYDAFKNPAIHFVASPYIDQRHSGQPILELCLKLANGESIPEKNYVQSKSLTYKNYQSQ